MLGVTELRCVAGGQSVHSYSKSIDSPCPAGKLPVPAVPCSSRSTATSTPCRAKANRIPRNVDHILAAQEAGVLSELVVIARARPVAASAQANG